MKKSKFEKIFLEELQKTSIISIACEKVGLSRQSVYRWMQEDKKFREKVNKAIMMGRESINDLAESKLISHIKEGRSRSIEYWLNNNKHNYLKPREVGYLRNLMSQQKYHLPGNNIKDEEIVVKWIIVNGDKSTEQSHNLGE